MYQSKSKLVDGVDCACILVLVPDANHRPACKEMRDMKIGIDSSIHLLFISTSLVCLTEAQRLRGPLDIAHMVMIAITRPVARVPFKAIQAESSVDKGLLTVEDVVVQRAGLQIQTVN